MGFVRVKIESVVSYRARVQVPVSPLRLSRAQSGADTPAGHTGDMTLRPGWPLTSSHLAIMNIVKVGSQIYIFLWSNQTII